MLSAQQCKTLQIKSLPFLVASEDERCEDKSIPEKLTVHPDPNIWENGLLSPKSPKGWNIEDLTTRAGCVSFRWRTKDSICADLLFGSQEEAQSVHTVALFLGDVGEKAESLADLRCVSTKPLELNVTEVLVFST